MIALFNVFNTKFCLTFENIKLNIINVSSYNIFEWYLILTNKIVVIIVMILFSFLFFM